MQRAFLCPNFNLHRSKCSGTVGVAHRQYVALITSFYLLNKLTSDNASLTIVCLPDGKFAQAALHNHVLERCYSKKKVCFPLPS